MQSTNETIYYEFGNFRLDVAQETLLKNGKPVTLTHKAFQTLLILVRNSGKIVEKDDLIAQIWTDSFVEESNLSQYIYLLRKILGTDEEGNVYIETITKRGFRFSAPITEFTPYEKLANEVFASQIINNNSISIKQNGAEQVNGNGFNYISALGETNEENKSLSAERQIVSDNQSFSFSQKTVPKSTKLKLIIVLCIILVLGLISTVLYTYYNHRVTTETSDSTTKSIAVLPFKPIGEESSNEKLGLGMADAVINRLNKLKRIPVRSTSSVFHFTDQPAANTVQAGRELGVEAVLEGTVQRDKGRVRVSVQLTSIADGKALWAESFDEDFTDIFTMQDKISAKVAQSLELNLTREQELELAQQAAKDPKAFQAYQLGIYFWNKRSKDSLHKSVGYFEEAIRIDPDYARAFAGLANSYNMLAYYKFADEKEMMAKASEAAEKALSLDNTLAEAHLALGYVQQYLHPENLNLAASSIERAIKFSPYNSNARVRYAWLLLGQNKVDESVSQARLAQEYDPLSHVGNNVLCGFLSFQHKYDEAIPYCEKAVSITPDAPRNRLVLAKLYFLNGREKDAFNQLQIQINSSNGIDRDEALGLSSYFYAKTGNVKEAAKILATLKPKAAEQPSLYIYLTLITHTLGNRTESLKYFKNFKELHQISADVLRFKYDPIWEEIRADKDFSLSRVAV